MRSILWSANWNTNITTAFTLTHCSQAEIHTTVHHIIGHLAKFQHEANIIKHSLPYSIYQSDIIHQSESLYTLTRFNPADTAKPRCASYLTK